MVGRAGANRLVVQVHRIQNRKLWKLFALHYGNMQERWSHEPGLHLVNGGLPMLWHGTSDTEPDKVYATEQGEDCCFACCALNPRPASAAHANRTRRMSESVSAGLAACAVLPLSAGNLLPDDSFIPCP